MDDEQVFINEHEKKKLRAKSDQDKADLSTFYKVDTSLNKLFLYDFKVILEELVTEFDFSHPSNRQKNVRHHPMNFGQIIAYVF